MIYRGRLINAMPRTPRLVADPSEPVFGLRTTLLEGTVIVGALRDR
jgi:hypothetical protein